jgi:menaquinone-dependent protoporphyrinogen oxidase
MEAEVLVTYASKYGSTAAIAERIAEVLNRAGVPATVSPVGQVRALDGYRAVVLGSGVYAGQWLKEAVSFLKSQESELVNRVVWIFSSGPTGQGDPVELVKGWRFPEGQRAIADRIGPCDLAVFHGSIDPDKLNLAEKLIVKGVKAPTGDFRDWDSIAAWAEGIAATLKSQA